ncbi:MAG: hydroxymethylbilane synthase [Methylococcales bacterium]|nr:hydroxymethylbilane synthase [Methylococcales bacterium]
MTVKIIRIATRKSPLALWQANHVAAKLKRAFPTLKTELVTMVTQGDKILDTPLAKIGGKGLFVKELEQGMLAGKADIAVHSMKDVPVEFPQGLHLAVILKREDPRDAFVSNQYASLKDLPETAKIGTCSLRRQCQLKQRFPKAQILPLRGNVNTRLAKLEAGQFDAIILAAAGLKRLQMHDKITECLATEISLPAIGQGAIGIESRCDDVEINRLLDVLKDDETTLCLRAERAMNARLKGGCQVPIAGFSEIKGSQIWMRGLVGNPDGSVIYRAETTGSIDDAAQIGIEIADNLLAQGADKILADLYI